MKSDILKKMIKQAVREAIQEELKDILMEAVRGPKATSIGTGGYGQVTETVLHSSSPVDTTEIRNKYSSMIEGMGRGATNMQFDSSHAAGFGQTGYRPSPMTNTAGEGSSLPSGEVSLDQIMGLMTK